MWTTKERSGYAPFDRLIAAFPCAVSNFFCSPQRFFAPSFPRARIPRFPSFFAVALPPKLPTRANASFSFCVSFFVIGFDVDLSASDDGWIWFKCAGSRDSYRHHHGSALPVQLIKPASSGAHRSP